MDYALIALSFDTRRACQFVKKNARRASDSLQQAPQDAVALRDRNRAVPKIIVLHDIIVTIIHT